MMRRVALGLALLAALFVAIAASEATVSNAYAEPIAAVDECFDSIDNDGDGMIDLAGGLTSDDNADEGCDDDTPATEKLTRAATLSHDYAEAYVEDVLDDLYGKRYSNAEDDWMSCWRVSRVTTSCRYGFARRAFLYSGVIRVHNYIHKDETWFVTHREYKWKQREPRLLGADEVTILKCSKSACSMRLTYFL